MSQTSRFFWSGASFVLLFLIALLVYVFSLPIEEQTAITTEDGPIEMASALGYLVCALALIFLSESGYLRRYFFIPIILFAMAARELDFDKQFTTFGVLKSRFYFDERVGWDERLIGGAIVLLMIYCVWRLFRSVDPSVWLRPWRWTYPIWGGVLAFGLVAFTKSIDGLARKLRSFGIEISNETGHNYGIFEEVLELGIPMMIGVIVLTRIRFKTASGV